MVQLTFEQLVVLLVLAALLGSMPGASLAQIGVTFIRQKLGLDPKRAPGRRGPQTDDGDEGGDEGGDETDTKGGQPPASDD